MKNDWRRRLSWPCIAWRRKPSSNVSRHAQASQASLSIRYQDETVELVISDNGVGFQTPTTPADFAPSGHFGLLGMYERADLIGAKLNIQSSPGKGTRLTILLPQIS